MRLPENRFKRALAQRRLQIGLWSQLVTPVATEILVDAGFDFIVVDAEHSLNDVLTVAPQLQIADRTSVSSVVRMPWNDMVLAKRYLDAGAQTLLIPYVQTPGEATQAVSYVRYPPRGVRGVATSHRGNRFGRVDNYFANVDREICVVVQVETESALGHLEEIAAVEGIDGIFIGPSDLAASMGHLGNPAHPDVQKAIEGVPARLAGSGKPGGILTPLEAAARRYIELGYVFVAVGNDIALLAQQTKSVADTYQDIRGAIVNGPAGAAS